MFDQVFGDFKEKQKAIQNKLEEILIHKDIQDGAVVMTVSGAGRIKSIDINSDKIDVQDTEQLEDLILVLTNELLEEAAVKQQEASSSLISDMMPPGLGGLADMFGQ